ncbi:MAG: CoB--CoM heterodisulfide reductase iron-sulfur subunit A family protein, partial [Thermoplasmata archaeon]|nr:CoB--CoM heterodisulfide reductase iron-sulfur subunit A family protein [Thermoplasmata archaeon]
EEEMQLKNNNDILIIGGGVAGITAALELLKHGINVHIVERTAKIGGRAFELDPERLVEEGITLPNIDDLTSNENAEILLESEVEDIQGTFGNYHIKIKTHEEESQKELDVGAIIIASGSELFNAKEVPEYSYQDEDVIDFFELDKMLANKELQVPSSGQVPKSVNFLQCVGSRDETKGNRHCSLLCCTYAIKQAIKIKNLSPGTEVYIHYMDLRGPDNGFEETYLDAQKKGVNFLRGRVAEVQRNDGNLKLRTELIEFGDVTDLKSDLVVLAVGQQAAKGTAKLANMIHLPLDIDGFLGYYNNRYDIIDRRGISIAGCAQGPRGIRQSILDAKKSSSEIATIMKSGFKPKTVHSIIDEARCKGCRLCEELCPYDAISMKTIEDYITEEVRLVSSVNLAACQGCGACAMVCPGGVPELVGFAFEEILAQIDEVI